MSDLDERLRDLVGPPAAVDLDALSVRVRRRRWFRRAQGGAVVSVLVVAGAVVLVGRGDPADDVVAGPGPAIEACQPAEVPAGELPEAPVAVAVVEEFLAARVAGSGAEACLSSDALAVYETGERFTDPHGEAATACLYFSRCPDGDQVLDAEVLSAGTTLHHVEGWAGRIVHVRLRYGEAGTVSEQLTVAWDPGPGNGSTLVVADVLVIPGAMVSAGEAEQLVTEFQAALAVGDWQRAAALFTNPAVGLGDPPGDWGADIERLLAQEPELAARGDLPGLLAAWCQRHRGACLPVGEILDTTPISGVARVVRVRLSARDGTVARFADGSDVAAFTIGWFESVTWVADLPPRLQDP